MRSNRAWALLLAGAVLLGCGHYGPPVRTHSSTAEALTPAASKEAPEDCEDEDKQP